jgi:Na+-transporting NADH:ubiquinone oxidoreductase subunit F
MIYIGGGAGMAPLRSHIFELFKRRHTNRKVSYWYGARSLREMFYQDEFQKIAEENPNFSFPSPCPNPCRKTTGTGRPGSSTMSCTTSI